MKLLGISGSLRHDAFNTRLLEAARELTDDDVELELYDGLKAIPPYDPDDEADAPAAVKDLCHALGEADAVLFATPEYNSSVPGQLKNALDWVSRPLARSPVRHKPVAVIGASSGVFGAVWAQAELRKVLGAMGARVLDGDVAVGQAATRFDESGRLVDDALRAQLAELVARLTETARARADALAARA